jgi:hypothetical protein
MHVNSHVQKCASNSHVILRAERSVHLTSSAAYSPRLGAVVKLATMAIRHGRRVNRGDVRTHAHTLTHKKRIAVMTRFPTEASMCCSVAVLLRQCRIARLLQVFDLLEVVRFGGPGLELPQCYVRPA